MYIHPKGSPGYDVWVLTDTPLSTDKDKGYLFSGGLGYAWDKMMKEAGFQDYYVDAYRPDLESRTSWKNITGELNHYQPRIIIPLDDIGQKLCPELKRKYSEEENQTEEEEAEESDIEKYAGSILTSPYLKYPHYIIPTIGPQRVMAQYKLRDIVVNLDLAKAHAELEYIKTNGTLQPLPSRNLKYKFDSFEEILYHIDSFRDLPLLSNDIECVYPKADSKYYKIYPGYPITVGLAPSKDFGISIDLFRESHVETTELWRRLNRVFRSTPQLGQNFLNFDTDHYQMLGFEIDERRVVDTLHRHHILWPELPHKLQFQTRQYTREPYYKDEGHGWSVKQMDKLKRYNCLDVCTTFEIWEQQELEFNERPYLR